MTVITQTTTEQTYGELNGHAIGIILKELVRRAIGVIRAERATFEAFDKTTEGKDDIVTSADFAAQALYVRGLKENFPGFGIIGEENSLSEPCTLEGPQYYFVVDPVDGTKAFARGQSSGVATQIALGVLEEGEIRILTAWVGDINTEEIYGYRPGSNKVHRIHGYQRPIRLDQIDRSRPLSAQYALLRQRLDSYPVAIQRMVESPADGGLVRDYQVGGGSATLTMSQLWKGEVGLYVLEPHSETPWDLGPVAGITEKLGFEIYELDTVGESISEVLMRVLPMPYPRDLYWIVVHATHSYRLQEWFAGSR